jgi:hypothetical protein
VRREAGVRKRRGERVNEEGEGQEKNTYSRLIEDFKSVSAE